VIRGPRDLHRGRERQRGGLSTSTTLDREWGNVVVTYDEQEAGGTDKMHGEGPFYSCMGRGVDGMDKMASPWQLALGRARSVARA
jgi:hypothetical protein